MDINFDKSYRGKMYINNKALKTFLVHYLATNYETCQFQNINLLLVRKYFLHLSFTLVITTPIKKYQQFLTKLEQAISNKLQEQFQLKLQNMNVLLN